MGKEKKAKSKKVKATVAIIGAIAAIMLTVSSIFAVTYGVGPLVTMWETILNQNLEKQDPAISEETLRPEKEIDKTQGVADDGEYVGKTAEEIKAELDAKQVYVTAAVSSIAVFENGEKGSTGSWIVENVPENMVLQQAEIYLDDKCIAVSPIIYPGQHIETVNLKEAVAPGSYDVTAYLNYYIPETEEYISKAGFKITLTVQS